MQQLKTNLEHQLQQFRVKRSLQWGNDAMILDRLNIETQS